jgi:hypothetical protein
MLNRHLAWVFSGSDLTADNDMKSGHKAIFYLVKIYSEKQKIILISRKYDKWLRKDV